jgi:hypothetical protein
MSRSNIALFFFVLLSSFILIGVSYKYLAYATAIAGFFFCFFVATERRN